MKIKTIIVDDEKISRDALNSYIIDYCPELEVVANCDSARSAFKSIKEFHPDLVFLDVEMPFGNGFDLLKMIYPIDFRIIFVTAFTDYAVKAFRYAAVDYLLKPVKVDEIVEAVRRVSLDISVQRQDRNVSTLLHNYSSGDGIFNQVVIPDLSGFRVIKLRDIIMCEADGYCSKFFLSDNSKITSTKNLKYYEEMFKGTPLRRVHNSYIVNINHVNRYSRQDEIFLSNHFSCPLGVRYKSDFLKLYKRLK
jgi:two-component system, LytTR family, response regulator